MTRSMHACIESLKLDRLYVVYPGAETYPPSPGSRSCDSCRCASASVRSRPGGCARRDDRVTDRRTFLAGAGSLALGATLPVGAQAPRVARRHPRQINLPPVPPRRRHGRRSTANCRRAAGSRDAISPSRRATPKVVPTGSVRWPRKSSRRASRSSSPRFAGGQRGRRCDPDDSHRDDQRVARGRGRLRRIAGAAGRQYDRRDRPAGRPDGEASRLSVRSGRTRRRSACSGRPTIWLRDRLQGDAGARARPRPRAGVAARRSPHHLDPALSLAQRETVQALHVHPTPVVGARWREIGAWQATEGRHDFRLQRLHPRWLSVV